MIRDHLIIVITIVKVTELMNYSKRELSTANNANKTHQYICDSTHLMKIF